MNSIIQVRGGGGGGGGHGGSGGHSSGGHTSSHTSSHTTTTITRTVGGRPVIVPIIIPGGHVNATGSYTEQPVDNYSTETSALDGIIAFALLIGIIILLFAVIVEGLD